MLSLEPLVSYQRRLDLGERYIHTLAEQAAQTTSAPPSKETLTSLERRQLAYASVIVHVYGSLEKYVEDLAEHTARAIGRSWAAYASLPQVVRDGHSKVTLATLSALAEKRYRGRSTTQGLLATWTSCEAGAPDWTLNAECYRAHTANIRTSTISSMFGALGVGDVASLAIGDGELKQFCREHDLGEDASFFLEDLAERRNGVAHGEVPDDLLSLPRLEHYVEALHILGDALTDSVCLALWGLGPMDDRLPKLDAPFEAFNGRRVVSHRAVGAPKVRVGTRLGWLTSDGHRRVGRIESIQVEGHAIDVTTDRPGEDFAIGLNRPYARSMPSSCLLTS